jgi:hypothetical protein
LIDTGLNTETGGRIKRLREWIGDETFLLTYGDGLADVNIRDGSGNTPLHIAASLGKKGAVALLISSNAMVNAQNQFGYSPLDVAMDGKDGSVDEHLLSGNNYANTVDKSSVQEIITLLREHGARTDLPRLDRIETRRPSAPASTPAAGARRDRRAARARGRAAPRSARPSSSAP